MQYIFLVAQYEYVCLNLLNIKLLVTSSTAKKQTLKIILYKLDWKYSLDILRDIVY